MKITRLQSNVSSHWALYPLFEERVTRFAKERLTGVNVPALEADLRTRWVQSPLLAGYWLGQDETGRQVAHLASWVANNWGVPFVFVYQAESDSHLADLADATLGGVDQWIAEINAVCVAGNTPQISHVEMTTWHDPKLWQRYFSQRGRDIEFVRYVMKWAVKEETSG